MSRWKITFEVERTVDADTYEEALEISWGSLVSGFVRVVDVKELK